MKKLQPRVKIGCLLCTKCNKVIHCNFGLKEADGETALVYCSECLHKLVYGYPTKYPDGFLYDEYMKLIKRFNKYFNLNQFHSALGGVTCMMGKGDDGLIIYHCDIELAIQCGMENREPTASEWD